MAPDTSMSRDPPTDAMGFHTTRWTVVLAAKASEAAGAEEALGKLCSTYWLPLYSFIRRRGASPHEAEDLTQEFFAGFLERGALQNVTPAGGKFRSFLLACVKHFLSNEHARARTQRRGGGQWIRPLDVEEAESRYLMEPAETLSSDILFDRTWAVTLLDRAMEDLQQENATDERRELFGLLKGFLPGGVASISRAELASQRGVGVGAIDVAVHRLRQRFGVLLRERVARTVSAEDEVEDELRYLISIVGRSG